MKLHLSWLLLLPALLSALYGITEYYALPKLDNSRENALKKWAGVFLPSAVLTTGWAAAGFPLPVFYLLMYLTQSIRYLANVKYGKDRMKGFFFMNLYYINTLSLHLFFIGLAAIMQKVTMPRLLDDMFWRAASVSCILLITILEDLAFIKTKRLYTALTAACESPEARPFMAFLWFSNGYLLMDSLLCVAGPESFYTPLFLMGSCAFLMFFQIRFLFHINSLIRSNHLRQEYDALSVQLKEELQNMDTLRQMADRDALTGVFSRKSMLERIEILLQSQQVFSVVFIDLDHLKKINDEKGHDAGDRYLISFAAELGRRMRSSDILSRVGGDEFVILMPGCDSLSAAKRMEDIRNSLPRSSMEQEGFRFSFGVAGRTPDSAENAAQLLKEADRNMYRDKAARR